MVVSHSLASNSDTTNSSSVSDIYSGMMTSPGNVFEISLPHKGIGISTICGHFLTFPSLMFKDGKAELSLHCAIFASSTLENSIVAEFLLREYSTFTTWYDRKDSSNMIASTTCKGAIKSAFDDIRTLVDTKRNSSPNYELNVLYI
jgi:hypothetical protein